MIAAHYGFSDVFDNLIISLCKFTTLSSEVNLWIPFSFLNYSDEMHLLTGPLSSFCIRRRLKLQLSVEKNS